MRDGDGLRQVADGARPARRILEMSVPPVDRGGDGGFGALERVADDVGARTIANLDAALHRRPDDVVADVGDAVAADRRRSPQVLVPEVVVVADAVDVVLREASSTAHPLGARSYVARQIVADDLDVGHRQAVAAGDVDASVRAVGDRAMVDHDIGDRAATLRCDVDAVVHPVTDPQAADDDVALEDVEDAGPGGPRVLAPEGDPRRRSGRAIDGGAGGDVETRRELDPSPDGEFYGSAVARGLGEGVPQRSGTGIRERRHPE